MRGFGLGPFRALGLALGFSFRNVNSRFIDSWSAVDSCRASSGCFGALEVCGLLFRRTLKPEIRNLQIEPQAL